MQTYGTGGLEIKNEGDGWYSFEFHLREFFELIDTKEKPTFKKYIVYTPPYQRSSWEYNDYGSDVFEVEAPSTRKAKALALKEFRRIRSDPVTDSESAGKNPFAVLTVELAEN